MIHEKVEGIVPGLMKDMHKAYFAVHDVSTQQTVYLQLSYARSYDDALQYYRYLRQAAFRGDTPV